jgi:hypothetical protein
MLLAATHLTASVWFDFEQHLPSLLLLLMMMFYVFLLPFVQPVAAWHHSTATRSWHGICWQPSHLIWLRHSCCSVL